MSTQVTDVSGRETATPASSDAAQVIQGLNRGPKEATAETDLRQRVIESLIEEHILPKLDPDFLEYFVSTQVKLGAQPQQPIPNPSIQDVRAHPEAYQSPCALDTSGHPEVSDFSCPSRDGVDIPVRVYHPDAANHGAGPYPVHLNFHGESPLPWPHVC